MSKTFIAKGNLIFCSKDIRLPVEHIYLYSYFQGKVRTIAPDGFIHSFDGDIEDFDKAYAKAYLFSKNLIEQQDKKDSIPSNDLDSNDSDSFMQTRLKSAINWLRSILANGPVEAEQIESLAARDGISWASVRRAQKSLGIKPRNSGYQGKWSWELPEDRNPAVDLIDNKKE